MNLIIIAILLLLIIATCILFISKKIRKIIIKYKEMTYRQKTEIIRYQKIFKYLYDFISKAQAYSRERLMFMLPTVLYEIFQSTISMIYTYDIYTNKEYIISHPLIPRNQKKEKKYLHFFNEINKNLKQIKEPILISDFLKKFDIDININSMMLEKLQLRENMYAIISLGTVGNFSSHELRIFRLFNDIFLSVYRNLQLTEEIRRMYLDVILLLSHMIEIKDVYTARHAQRSSYYARKISQRLGLPESVTRWIELASMLHDVGKLTIESSILTKPGALISEEKKEIEKHPLLGTKILEPILYFKSVVPIIKFHHEWYNGNGYPEKLAGETIPLGARIVAVLDAFDAMTSDRPYRKALTLQQAIDELKKGANVQFDPEVVSVFIDILQEEM